VNEKGPIRFEHQEPNGFRQSGGQASGVEDFAASHNQSHWRSTVLSVSDVFLARWNSTSGR
jgi:hypothetical protein